MTRFRRSLSFLSSSTKTPLVVKLYSNSCNGLYFIGHILRISTSTPDIFESLKLEDLSPGLERGRGDATLLSLRLQMLLFVALPKLRIKANCML